MASFFAPLKPKEGLNGPPDFLYSWEPQVLHCGRVAQAAKDDNFFLIPTQAKGGLEWATNQRGTF
jgi:hypothetical protein